jgi:hypothetical protein
MKDEEGAGERESGRLITITCFHAMQSESEIIVVN